MGNKIQTKCDYCDKKIERYLSELKHSYKYCSLKCHYEHKRVRVIKENYKHFLSLNEDFINWFSGFWEGEGSLIIACQYRNVKTPQFTLYQSDLKVIKYIKNKFKVGKISIQLNTNKLSKKLGYVFRTQKFGECVLFAYILKDRLRSQYKKQQLNNWMKEFKMKKYFKYIKE